MGLTHDLLFWNDDEETYLMIGYVGIVEWTYNYN